MKSLFALRFACWMLATADAENKPATKKKRIVANCGTGVPSTIAKAFIAQNRSVEIIVQTATGAQNNVCEGHRSDWREGLGQCLATLSGVRVIARNWDGTCADCEKLTRLPSKVCDKLFARQPPGLIIVIGGGDPVSKSNKYICTATYCRRTLHTPIVVGREADGLIPPDYQAGCDVFAHNKHGNPIFRSLFKSGHVTVTSGDQGTRDATLKLKKFKKKKLKLDAQSSVSPPPRLAWIPLVSPISHIRVLWEQSSLYAGVSELINTTRLPALKYRTPPLHKPRTTGTLSDYVYLKQVIEPAFSRTGRLKIDVVRDDSFPKPLLLPLAERKIFEDSRLSIDMVRTPKLFYIGQFRESKGQLALLSKLDERSLGPFILAFRGSRSKGSQQDEDYWQALLAEAARFSPGKIVLSDERISHEFMMAEMAKASGLIHFATADRNPRVIYEAMYFGLPLFVSIQSMPYIALQCQTFVTLADANQGAGDLNLRFSAWVNSIAANERRKAEISRGLLDANTTWTFQRAMRHLVDAHLTPNRVFSTFCERFALCAPSGKYIDVRTPWYVKESCAAIDQSLVSHTKLTPVPGNIVLPEKAQFTDTFFQPRECSLADGLWRYENYHQSDAWKATKIIRKGLDISNVPACNLVQTRRNCREGCFELNRIDREMNDKARPWWMPEQHMSLGDPSRNCASQS